MSRCFPFPPPGYEKQARPDDVDVLKKEKQREKKHKKEKKEKERREKEKGEEDRGDRKHREKKDKKEKNRDKKKDKEKGKAKDDPDTADGTRIPWKTENHRAEKLIRKDDRDKKDVGKVEGHQAEKLSHPPVENRNSVLVEFARKTKGEPRGIGAEKLSHKDERDKKDAGKVGGQQAEKLGQNCHPPVENRNSVLVELARKTKEEPKGIGADKFIHRVDSDEKNAGKVGGQQAEKLSQNSHPPVENRNSVLVELSRKTKEEPRFIRNQLVEKTTGSDWKKDEGMVRFVAKTTDILAGVKERLTDKRIDDRKAGVEGVRDATQVGGIAMVQPKVKGIPKPLENNIDRKTDGKEKTKEKEGDDNRGEKRKDRDRDKRNQGKDKDRDKEKKKEEKAKKKNPLKNAEPYKEKEDKANEKNGSKHAELDKSIESNKEVYIDTHYAKISQIPKDSNNSADAEGNHKKRKTNGALHADDIRPNKLLRPSSSPHPLTANGRTLEPCQTSIPYISDKLGGANSQTSISHVSEKQGGASVQCSTPYISDKQGGGANGQSSTPYISDRQGGANRVKVDSKERKKNDIIEVRSSSVTPAKPTSAAAQADPLAEANMRPPHPDSKYIREVYMVPTMEELSDHDDQEWLFGCSDTKSKKLKLESLGAEETALVWSEALRIESADIYALPYVIPY